MKLTILQWQNVWSVKLSNSVQSVDVAQTLVMCNSVHIVLVAPSYRFLVPGPFKSYHLVAPTCPDINCSKILDLLSGTWGGFTLLCKCMQDLTDSQCVEGTYCWRHMHNIWGHSLHPALCSSDSKTGDLRTYLFNTALCSALCSWSPCSAVTWWYLSGY